MGLVKIIASSTSQKVMHQPGYVMTMLCFDCDRCDGCHRVGNYFKKKPHSLWCGFKSLGNEKVLQETLTLLLSLKTSVGLRTVALMSL